MKLSSVYIQCQIKFNDKLALAKGKAFRGEKKGMKRREER